MLINAISLLAAQATSEIENIVTAAQNLPRFYATSRASTLVVVSASDDADFVSVDFVDQAMLVDDPPGPVAAEAVLQRFWLPEPAVFVSGDAAQQRHSTRKDPSVLCFPHP